MEKGLAVNQSIEQTIFIDIGGNNLKCSRQAMIFSFSYFSGFFYTEMIYWFHVLPYLASLLGTRLLRSSICLKLSSALLDLAPTNDFRKLRVGVGKIIDNILK